MYSLHEGVAVAEKVRRGGPHGGSRMHADEMHARQLLREERIEAGKAAVAQVLQDQFARTLSGERGRSFVSLSGSAVTPAWVARSRFDP